MNRHLHLLLAIVFFSAIPFTLEFNEPLMSIPLAVGWAVALAIWVSACERAARRRAFRAAMASWSTSGRALAEAFQNIGRALDNASHASDGLAAALSMVSDGVPLEVDTAVIP